jgi:hypothetical protein
MCSSPQCWVKGVDPSRVTQNTRRSTGGRCPRSNSYERSFCSTTHLVIPPSALCALTPSSLVVLHPTCDIASSSFPPHKTVRRQRVTASTGAMNDAATNFKSFEPDIRLLNLLYIPLRDNTLARLLLRPPRVARFNLTSACTREAF